MHLLRALIPAPLLSYYHYAAAHLAAWYWGHPSRKLVVVGITGTKGKSSVSELTAAALRAGGHKVAVASTIHFVIDDVIEPNLYKMTMPGRGRLQRFLRRAVDAGCTHAVVEMTSEGALQHRHAGIEMDALIFTNLAPEHIQRHGSFEAYGNAKLQLAKALEQSPKRPRTIVANADDAWGKKFLDIEVEKKAPFSLKDAEPYQADDKSVRFVWRKVVFTVPLLGVFNLKNCLAALNVGEALGVPVEKMRGALEHIRPIAGRQERIEAGQPFTVIVDNAHTPDSLEALFSAFTGQRCIGLVGSMGGGRDTWNRPVKGAIAEKYCDIVILSDEDPCDEDPKKILDEIASGVTTKKPLKILDRRQAIYTALREARTLRQTQGNQNVVVLITGKGTDPYILAAKGSRIPWSDARVVKEELGKLGYGSSK